MQKQFKQKNRKKRKYIKRNSPASSVSLSRSYLIRLMPYAIMAVGLLTTLAITPPTLQTFQPIHPISINLTKPTLPFDSIRTLHEMALFLSSVLAQLQKLTAEVMTLFTQIAMQVITFLEQCVTTISYGITISISGITYVGIVLGKGIATIFFFIWHMLTLIIQTIVTVTITIIKAIFDTLTFIMIKIGEGLNAAWYFLTTPFRAMVAYYMTIKPYLDFIGNNIKQSTLFLIQSMSMVMGG